MPPKIIRFDAEAHSFAGFRTGVSDVDEFFHPHSGYIGEMRKKRMGDIFVAVGEDDAIVGCVAYTPRSAPNKFIRQLAPALWKSRRHKPLDRGNLDSEQDLIIPAIRVVILGVRLQSQNAGVGSALLRHVFSAVTAPFYYLYSFPPAVPFYKKFGFQQFHANLRAKDGATTAPLAMFKVDGFPD